MKRFIAIFMTFCLVLGMSSVSVWADETIWQNRTSIPTASYKSASCVVGNKIYIMGGQISGKPISGVYIYDTISDKWFNGNSMPEANAMFAVSLVGDEIYVFGGQTENGVSNLVRIYDITTDTWTSGTPMPKAGYFLSSTVIDNKIYVFSGSSLQIYDISTNTWTSGTPMLTTRVSFTTVKVDDKIYVIGGTDLQTPNAVKDVVEIYDTKTDTWSSGKKMPQARSAITSCLVGDNIYIMGGAIHPTPYNAVDIYNITTDTWASGPVLNEARKNSTSAYIDGKIYIIGGMRQDELKSVESLAVESTLPKLSVLLNEEETVRLSTSFSLDNNAKYTWSSTNEAVATVDVNGKVTAISEGTADIYAQNADGTFKEYIPIKVVKGIADELRLAVHLKTGEKEKLYLTDDGSKVTWTSMDESIATVSADGQVTGVKKGLAIVKAELDGQTYQIYVRVNG